MVLVKTLTDKIATVDVQENNTVADVKAKIKIKTEMPVIIQRLSFKRNQLNGEAVLLQISVRK